MCQISPQKVRNLNLGVDPAKLKAAVEYVANGLKEYGGAGTLFMVRNGYAIGAGPECDRQYQIYSATKSFTSTVLGLLIDDGKVTLSTLAKDLEPALAKQYPAVTLRHFATMTSGYDSVGGSYEFDSQKRGDSWNPGPPAPPLFPPGTKFRYWDDAMMQFGSLLTKAAGEPLDRLIKRRIADPIGITKWRWTESDSSVGRVLCWTGGIHTSSRELARFGHLFLNRGNWNGRQLISASWVGQATSVQVPASIPNDELPRSRGAAVYGYNWWVNGIKPNGERLWPGAPPRTFYANGLHNNVCIVVPEWNMVIARTNGARKGGGTNTPPNVDEIWSGFFTRLGEAVASPNGAKRPEGDQPRSPGSAPRPVPIRLHPDNPHYFLWRGKPTVLITSGEHYGAVINLDFDYVRYLDQLQAHRFNLTRAFSGAYREVAGSFDITGNTLAPAPGRYLCPWSRSSTPGASVGGNKFDLAKWDPAYFKRLKDFVAQAGRRGVVVELVLFCTMYDENVWSASPMNARNNTKGIGAVGRHDVYAAKDKDLLAAQQAVVRKIVAELRDFDNVYFEVCNEPYERPGLTPEWNDQIIAAIVEAEAALPAKHLIAQGVGHRAAKVARLNENVSVCNFHAATAEAVRLNYGLGKVIADDETGGADHSDRKYRTEGWDFILAGGGVYDHLDFSFSPGREDGMAVPLPPGTPGGGGPGLRRQLAILKEFIEGFDFVRMGPDHTTIASSRIAPAVAGKSQTAREPTVRALAEPGKTYAVYVHGGTRADLVLRLPAGSYRAEWVNTKTGAVEKSETFRHAVGSRAFASPAYAEDIALRVARQPPAAGSGALRRLWKGLV